MTRKKLTRDTVTYLVWWTKADKHQPVRRVTVPATWRATIGQDAKDHSGHKMLRFYEGTLQRVCFAGVLQFCDETVQVAGAPEYEAAEKIYGEMPRVPFDTTDGVSTL